MIAALAANSWSATLFTTADGFSNWASNAQMTLNSGPSGDTDGSTINGLGNLTNPGGTGTAGARLLLFSR